MISTVRTLTTKTKVNRVECVDNMIKEQIKTQMLVADVMYLFGQTFLVSVAVPLLLVMSVPTGQQMEALGKALMSHVELSRSRSFDVERVEVDPQRGLVRLKNKIDGIEIDIVGAGDHLPRVDAAIRRIKEMARSIVAGLPYNLPTNKANALATYVVNRRNTRRTKCLSDNVCPRVRFTERKVDYRVEFGMGFGDYCEVYNPGVTSNSMDERTQSCIALYPTGNATGDRETCATK